MPRYEIVRTEQEINAMVNDCTDRADNGDEFARGFREAIEWLTDRSDPDPTEELSGGS